MPKFMKSPVKLLAGLLILCATILCSCVNEPDVITLEGNYCTVRDGFTGLVSSEIHISPDTTGNHDYIISNISGYPIPSDAYRDVSAYLVGDDVLRIPEYEHVISNDVNLKIWGRGELQDGFFKFEIHTKRDDQVTFELTAIDNSYNLKGKTFGRDAQEIKFNEESIDVKLIDEDQIEHSFNLPLVITSCSVQDLETTVLNTSDSVEESLRVSLFNSGDKLKGMMAFSRDNWNTESKVEFSLPIVN